MAFPKVLIERDTDSEQSSSSDDEDELEEEDEGPPSEPEPEPEEEDSTKNGYEERIEEDLSLKKKGKAPITISLKKVCKVSYFPLKVSFFPFF
jgi:DNA damage-binding protein 2